MEIRKASVGDVPRIKELIDNHKQEGFMLPRPLSELYENVRDFFVVVEDGEIYGCVGLHIVWGDLAEIKSIVVEKRGRKRGWGRALVDACLAEARKMQIKRVFALTKIPEFFIKLGFDVLDMAQLPHKVWAECIKCHKFPKCDEIAVGVIVCEANDIPVPSHDFEPMFMANGFPRPVFTPKKEV